MGRTQTRWLAQAGLLTTLALGACADDKATAIVVAVHTEGRIPDDVSRLEIVVERDGKQFLSQPYELPADTRLPGTLTIEQDGASTSPVRVVVRAKDASSNSWRVVREARLGFSEQKTKLLRMALRFSCFDAADCADGSTCVGGECQDASVDAEALPEFEGNDALTRTKEQGGCFDEAKCVTKWQIIPRAALDDRCSFVAPSPVGSFNVLMEWSASKGRRIVLDADEREGFTLDGDRVVLSPGVCKAFTGQPDARARVLGISAACPTKSPLDPVCVDAQSPRPGGAGGVGGAGAGGAQAGTSAGGASAGKGGASSGGAGAGGGVGETIVDGPNGSKASIPGGATGEPGAIKVTVAIPADVPPVPQQYEQGSFVYAFTPHGQTFSAPVTIEVPGASAFSQPLLLTAPPGGPWAEIPATRKDQNLVASVNHFSFFTVTALSGAGGAGGGTGGAAGAGGGCGDTQKSSSNCGECGYSCGTNECKFGVCAALNLNLGSNADVLADGGYVYGAQVYNDRIVRAPVGGLPAGTEPDVVATPTRPYALLLDSDYVYWHTVGGEFGRLPRKGGSPETVGSSPPYFDSTKSPGTIALHDGVVYFSLIGSTTADTGIYTMSASGGAAVNAIPLGTAYPGPLFVDPSHVYWATQSGDVKRAPKASLGVSSVESLASFPNGVRAFQQDGTDLLVASGEEVLRMPKSGGSPTQVTKSAYGILAASLIVHGGQVFYGHSGGRVEHAPLTGGNPHTRCDGSGPMMLRSDGVTLFYPTLSGNSYRCDLP